MYIDSHAHLYSDQFIDDLDAVVDRSLATKVSKVLLPNIDMGSVDRMLLICDQHPEVLHPMVGLHPCSVKEDYQNQLDRLYPYLDDERVIAVGEMGTDLYWDKSYIDQQVAAFRIQVDWAKERNLPIVIHCRESIDMTIELVRELQDGTLRGVFHCFGGSLEQAQQIMDLGFYMGIGGTSTFKNNKSLREVLVDVPLTSLILETDAPYLTPHPYRGQRNESSYIPLIAETLAIVYQMTPAAIAEQTTDNVFTLFDRLT